MNDATVADRERELLEHVAALARVIHQEREQLAARLAELERELSVLATTLDGQPAVIALGGSPQPQRA